MKYNKSQIMKNAWAIYRSCKAAAIAFGECLKRAWAEVKGQVVKATTRFVNGMTVTADGYNRTLTRWTKGGHDRVYINGGSRLGDGFVDLKNRTANLRGELTYQVKIADMILAMAF